MKLKWLGHSCFLITSDKGLKIITDPYTPGGDIKYSPVTDAADIVIVSHDHFDHNNISMISGKPEVVRGGGITDVKEIRFKGVLTYHDESQGEKRGTNTVFCFSVDGITLCHLGDLGHKLSREQVAEIGDVDVLLVPVGGFYTVDASVASRVCDDLKPRVIIPMHFKTSKCDFPIVNEEDFLRDKGKVKKLDSSEIEFKQGELPDVTEIVVLKPAQ